MFKGQFRRNKKCVKKNKLKFKKDPKKILLQIIPVKNLGEK